MIDPSAGNLTPENEAFFQDEFVPAVEGIAERFVRTATAASVDQGWRADHAEAAAALGVAPFLERLLNGSDPQDAVEAGIALGRKQALGAMFSTELAEGRSRHEAFRAILELQRENAGSRGEEPVEFPEDWMTAALAEVDAAAANGQPSEDQVAAGLSALAACAVAVLDAGDEA